jgi:hypothetical protein
LLPPSRVRKPSAVGADLRVGRRMSGVRRGRSLQRSVRMWSTPDVGTRMGPLVRWRPRVRMRDRGRFLPLSAERMRSARGAGLRLGLVVSRRRVRGRGRFLPRSGVRIQFTTAVYLREG